MLGNARDWSLANLNYYYTWAVAFFVVICLIIAVHPRWGKLKLGAADGVPEFSNFSWFSMMFGARGSSRSLIALPRALTTLQPKFSISSERYQKYLMHKASAFLQRMASCWFRDWSSGRPESDYNVTTVGEDISGRWQTLVESRVTLRLQGCL